MQAIPVYTFLMGSRSAILFELNSITNSISCSSSRPTSQTTGIISAIIPKKKH